MAHKPLKSQKSKPAKPRTGTRVPHPMWPQVDPVAIAMAFLEEQQAAAQVSDWLRNLRGGAAPAR